MGGMVRTGRGRERSRAEIAVIQVLEKRLGALPVVAEFGRRLRIAEIVDELCPVRPVAWITHGEVVEALVANRLTAPAPLLRVQDWAAAMAVEEAYGIAPELLNDDRIARVNRPGFCGGSQSTGEWDDGSSTEVSGRAA